MSSSLNSSALQRTEGQTAVIKFDAQALVLRKTDPEAGGMLVGGNDAFAQIFANTQEAQQKPRTPVADVKDDVAPERAPTAPTTRPAHCAKPKKTDGDDAADATDTHEAHDADTATKPRVEAKTADKKDGKHVCKTNAEKKSDDADADAKVVSDAAQQAPKNAQAADTVDVTAAETTVASDQQAAMPDASAAAAAFCLPAVLKAQEAAASEGTANDESGEQEGTAGKTGIADLISFRANSGTGDKKAGKAAALAAAATPAAGAAALSATSGAAKSAADASADADADTQVKADAKTNVKIDVTTLKPIDVSTLPAVKVTTPWPTLHLAAQTQATVSTDAANDAAKQFSTAVHATSPDKSESRAAFSATPETEINNSASADAAVSPTPPAAGSRVNALTGFPAPPPPTGSGSGSPLSAKAASGTGVDNVQGLGAISTSARIDGGAVIQLAKAVKTDGAGASLATEQVSVALTRSIKNGGSSFEVQLSPAELGKVSIKLDITKDGMVNAVVTSDNPATHDMLQKDAKQLEKIFQQAGLQTDSGSLSFNLRSDAQQQQAANQGEGQQNWKRWMGNTQNAETNVKTETKFYATAAGRVDLMI